MFLFGKNSSKWELYVEQKDFCKRTDGEVEPTEEMNLIGKNARLDSMKLVELCLSLEDQAGDLGFEFDWTSEAAMSRSRSLFRTVSSLAEEFHAQAEAQA